MEHDILISLAAVTHFWACGFPDMIEFECTLPYTKVSACCGNISCEQRPLIQTYRGNSSADCTFMALCWLRVFTRLDERVCTTREEHIAGQGGRKKKKNTKKKIKQSAKKEDASSCRFGCSEPCWAEPTNFQLCRCTCRLIPIQGLFFLFCHEDDSSWQIKCSVVSSPESWEEVWNHTNPQNLRCQ